MSLSPKEIKLELNLDLTADTLFSFPPPPAHLRSDECRICLSSVEQESNHLISPCSCSGSLEFVH